MVARWVTTGQQRSWRLATLSDGRGGVPSDLFAPLLAAQHQGFVDVDLVVTPVNPLGEFDVKRFPVGILASNGDETQGLIRLNRAHLGRHAWGW